ncbi:Nucleotidyl transferase [Ruminiclostridium papyrosolvens DSM 2782]|uniref:Nucleotidyl transferase n=1 Tax=Ruminiclostridium papyrosolvens DSM 2782 TaxID=588581 RepID=F1TAJ6_9FIRM|nr:mannose-1-phosphate guanyltransferase [Ruminiclostridium papyrosolvens]EGD48539.1 Nucleotidyl transferase [Ruminiclostridium papyrosolvens DSM 2782]WES32705.1 mannose-1-phosphate guanyltransferase [Ruminiclostridium papyrosolvens DSM 2782]
MKAVIMAGGEGSRLRPLTCNRPKPMVPIANKPVMEHIIELLKKYGIKDIAVTLQYMPEKIKDYFGDGREYGVSLKYFTEDVPLGTAGSVKNAEDFLDETFIVISGDALTDINLQEALEFHKKNRSVATLVLKKVECPTEYGVVVTAPDGKIRRFLEKPSWGEVFSDTVNTGIYVLSPEVLKYFEKGVVFDFSKDLFPILLKKEEPMYGFVTQDYWCDIGDLDAYVGVHTDILDKKVNININAREIRQGVWASEGAVISKEAVIKPPVLIGKNSVVKDGSILGRYSVIGEECHIGEGSTTKRSVLWNSCILKNNVELRGSVLCSGVKCREKTAAFEGTVVGENCILGENSLIKPGIKIWPEKHIDMGTEVCTNIVWGSRYSKNLFGSRGISGEVNVDITPEFASRMAAAYGAVCKKGSGLAISCEEVDALKMVKNACVSGVLSTGTEAYDLGTSLLPVTRSAIRYYNLSGGIHISEGNKKGKIIIDILDNKGRNISRNEERKIENCYIREDFARCQAEEIKAVINVPDHKVFYIRSILNHTISEIHDLKIALIAPSGDLKNIVTAVLNELKCRYEFVNTKEAHDKQKSLFSDLKTISQVVRRGGFDVGVYFANSYDKIFLIDTKGRIIADDLYMALISYIHLKSKAGNKVIVPLNASTVIEKMAGDNKERVIRTKTSAKELMNRILDDEFDENMLDFFAMNFDPIEAFIRIIDYMAISGTSLAKIVDSIPDFHIIKKEVKCSWSAKGKVIRAIIEENSNSVETIEGVKVVGDKGWVLVLPDAEKPVCKVIGEGYTQEFAHELTDIFVDKVKTISQNKIT